eukprot:m.254042 g.254042  ORF g.254042 m.254042 type:complete len:54 (-) comp17642_c0_seq1:133-294(-)
MHLEGFSCLFFLCLLACCYTSRIRTRPAYLGLAGGLLDVQSLDIPGDLLFWFF